ncbi:conserved hypothetical protein [Theileria equi strain WA]|uniref:Matrin-type domain-containing protein n=1 Tax=Theileria equi strain WA TaxID=1537102 RepID=L1LE89_THEEQ|nr:conserved hypothetical protein [Theileria equi strain WA]EKX73599.1 conserved hypothetical protein [Theileria equi strain WA]|eukprot:XP_004833051.1 conserved hypothetical protein [Theileria equi strain WA]
MKFILERTREGQEDLEYLEKAISALLNDRRRASGQKLVTIETAIKNLVTEAQGVANMLLGYYGDTDGLRKKEIKFIADTSINNVTSFTRYTHWIPDGSERTFILYKELQDGSKIVESSVGVSIPNVESVSVYYWNGNLGKPILLEVTIGGGGKPETKHYCHSSTTGGGRGNWSNADNEDKELLYLLDENNCRRNRAVPFNINKPEDTSQIYNDDQVPQCVKDTRKITEYGPKPAPPGGEYTVKECVVYNDPSDPFETGTKVSRVIFGKMNTDISLPNNYPVSRIRVFSQKNVDSTPLILQFVKKGGEEQRWFYSKTLDCLAWGIVNNYRSEGFYNDSAGYYPTDDLTTELDNVRCFRESLVTMNISESVSAGQSYCCIYHSDSREGKVTVSERSVQVGSGTKEIPFHKHAITDESTNLVKIKFSSQWNQGTEIKRITLSKQNLPITGPVSVYAFYCQKNPVLIYIEGGRPLTVNKWFKKNGDTWIQVLNNVPGPEQIDDCTSWTQLNNELTKLGCQSYGECNEPTQSSPLQDPATVVSDLGGVKGSGEKILSDLMNFGKLGYGFAGLFGLDLTLQLVKDIASSSQAEDQIPVPPDATDTGNDSDAESKSAEAQNPAGSSNLDATTPELASRATGQGSPPETAKLTGGELTAAGTDVQDTDTLWNNYYSTLKNIKDYYRHNEQYNAPIEARNLKSMVKKACADVHLDSIFKPEENSGKCIYLQDFYIKFVNLQPLRNYRLNTHRQQEIHRLRNKGLTDDKLLESHVAPFVEMDYVTYLSTFHQFHLIPRYCKYRNAEYIKYLQDLYAYLADFFCRQNPLANSKNLEASMEESFKTSWESNSLQYWKDKTYTLELYNAPSDKLFSSKGVLESFTKGKKYAALLAKHLAREEEAKVSTDNGKDHSASDTNEGPDDATNVLPWYAKSVEHDREIARLEYLVCAYKETLQGTVDASIESVEKRESRTHKELNSLTEEILKAVEETPEVNLEESSEDEDEEKVVYNPLNLPLGWDGKPIPYWLYKLHGLGQEFKCEICGNYSYWGRKAFENHFQEWRHSFGMRCLKIPNTPHFKEITKIEDAFALYEKLKTVSDRNTFKVAQEAECEDSEGNLMSVKAYEDLKRQGLL